VTSEAREPGAERVVESQRKFEGRICNLRVDTVQLAGGRTAQREIVEHEPVVAIVPIDNEGNVVLVRQYRLATGVVLLEVPAGGVDPGETPEDAAQRELAEEIGMRAGCLERLVAFYVSPGFLTEYVYAFLATDLIDSPAEADEDEDIAVVRMPLSEAVAMAERGELRDAKSIVGLLLAARRILS
jgi:ADP-ribose pyrophosphatase